MGLEEKLKNMAPKQAAIIGLVLAVLYYLMMFDGGASYERQIVQKRKDIKEVKNELTQLDRAAREAKRYQKLVEERGQELEGAMEYLPEDFSLSDFMDILSTEAKAAGANIASITDRGGRSSRRGGSQVYEEFKVGVSLEGRFSQLLLFLSYLTRVNKIVTLESLEMSASRGGNSDNSSNVLTFDGQFVGYRYKGDDED